MAAVFNIGDILNQWQSAGIFDFLLPFLLIFAVVFAILSTTKVLGDKRGIHVIIAFVIGLLALQGGFVQRFFQPLFPRFAIGLSIILIGLILVGLFFKPDKDNDYTKYYYWGFGAIAVIILIIVVSNAFEEYGWTSSSFYGNNAGWIIGAVLLLGLIIAIATTGTEKKDKNKEG
jgi:NADH:ubiquinone oxidoreductase subunit 6 (subunit J)